MLLVDGRRFEDLGSQDVLFHSHISASCYIIALNIVSLGYFTWRNPPSLHPVYVVRNPTTPEIGEKVALLQQQSGERFQSRKELSYEDVERSILIYGALLKDEDQNSRTEYMKGLLHMSASHLDITFYRDAFANFYRCVEFFVTRRILHVKRLSNEFKQIQKALKLIGADEQLAGYFQEVYALRSAQVAHSQNQQVKLAFDDVLKAKAFADIIMYKTYRKQAEEWRASRQA